MNKLNTSIKLHLLIGVFISFWIFVFTYYIKPFDTGISYFDWDKISIGFSSISFICYAILAILQKVVYDKIRKWNITLEISAILFFHILNLIVSYNLYKSPLFRGIYEFWDFASLVFQFSLIFTPILVLARIYIVRLVAEKPKIDDQEIVLTIKGENRLDVLQVNKSDLVCITNAQNYVEIFFIEEGNLGSKLIRSSLKSMKEELNFLIQVHRSHLINPSHFRSWKNSNTIRLTHMDVPVSKTFDKDLLPH
ncbi:LytTR family DNA-binding domain-containing protein [uncultured Aquimarina sp.]|uniref:LytTR family DNA-binding domain-containing protein n=1 Tax=uncultured Aquimarina sp. TaxID=575652 RepID=UPI002604313D|nr:LytTR family DNA-binding domain-containing protein [uncultured Aquimarina sp.]